MKFLTLSLLLFMTVFAAIADTTLFLTGNVKDALTRTDLLGASVSLYDQNGNIRYTSRGHAVEKTHTGEEREKSWFRIPISDRRDSVYTFDVECKGYMTKTVVYRLKNVGKREQTRVIPTIYLEREPLKLDEVVVKASKIKFYYKGDTLVYDADAFQLSNGAMLDELVSMLPGVKVSSGGMITVGGQYVETLLLNGKKFFDGNNNLMLRNIAAYTVKDIQVYYGQTDKEKWQADSLAVKHYTMDVKLRKEYQNSWLVNAQAGAGTEGRYTGRLFSGMNSTHKSLSLIGNINNLNDNRTPGKNDFWRPEMMPRGTKVYKMGGFNYDLESNDESRRIEGHLTYEQTGTKNNLSINRTNFLSSGDTYGNSYSHRYSRDVKMEARDYLKWNNEKIYTDIMAHVAYITKDNESRSLSAEFNSEQTDMTAAVLEAIYTAADPGRLEEVINRSISKCDDGNSTWDIHYYHDFEWKIPRTSDRVGADILVKYWGRKADTWDDRSINYGPDPHPAYRLRQYTDGDPNFHWTFANSYQYVCNFRDGSFVIQYEYRYMSQKRGSYMYALDRLEDMGMFGTLPAGWLGAFDPSNSFSSRLIENTHTVDPRLSYRVKLKGGNDMFFYLMPSFQLKHSHYVYLRDNSVYVVKPQNLLTTLKANRARIDLRLDRPDGEKSWRHNIRYNYILTPTTPSCSQMIDVLNDADPLYLSVGNPDLKPEYTHNHTLTWSYSPVDKKGFPVISTLRMGYTWVKNSLTRGYTYDTATGVRCFRTYNVDGNASFNFSEDMVYSFGPSKRFSLSGNTSYNFSRYADMIGIDRDEPTRSQVRNNMWTESLRLEWTAPRVSFSLNGSVTNRHTSSNRENFNVIDARNFQTGLSGTVKLPANFGIDTDLTWYGRRGYGSKELDTDDLVWNLRLTYAPDKSWVFIVDGFDMLHQLSDVIYSVGATGRTVTYTNSLPRYALFSVQYKFNYKPRKR